MNFGYDFAHPSGSSILEPVDNRAKLVVLAGFLFLVMSVSKFDPVRVCAFAAFPLFVILADRLPLRPILMRLMVVSPFILSMAAANPFLDSRPVMIGEHLQTTAGMISGMVIILKALLSVLGIMTFVRTVSIYGICDALRRLHVPEPFTSQLMLLYRFGFLLGDVARNMLQARDMRCFHGRGKSIRVTAHLIGLLLVRSNTHAERIFKAMVARGFNGTFHSHPHRPFRLTDTVFTAFVLALMGAIRIMPL